MKLLNNILILPSMVHLVACVAPTPKPVSEMTFDEYQKSLGYKPSPYASMAEFKNYEAWTAAGGYKKSPPVASKQLKGSTFGEVIAMAAAGMQLANAINSSKAASSSGRYSQVVTRTSALSGGSGGWYPYVHQLGPGAGYFLINGKKYDYVEMKPGNGSLARPIGPPRPN